MRMLSRCHHAAWLALLVMPGDSGAQTMEHRLLAEDAALLVRQAREEGDVARGAILFHQPYMACSKCHVHGDRQQSLGPDLTQRPSDASDIALVEAVLSPSKQIRKGYESVTVATTDGQVLTGLVAEDTPQHLVLLDASVPGRGIAIPREQIEELVANKNSIMPPGQVNQLASRQQFLDLLRYLMEISEQGLPRARELEPPPSAYAARPLPEYEQDIDHAAMIRELDRESYRRGEAIHDRLCANCHGTHEQPGSLPTSLRFAEGRFKNGSDPFTMYQTLTRGFGMMVAQHWMVPQQKYDVIHYLREAYLKRHNPSQYFAVDDAYLAGLPRGNTRGPAPSEILPWEQMDYGHNLVATYEIGGDGANLAYKGNAMRLDPGPGGVSQGRSWMIFDYDTLRMAAAWTGEGFIDWNGINFNGKHGVHPRVVGEVHAANPIGPGWANPNDGTFDDPRLRGRDGKPYGPLPRDWAHYKGMYYHGQKVIIAYTVGDTDVLEMPRLVTLGEHPCFARSFQIGPRDRELTLQVTRDERSPVTFQPLAARDGSHVVLFGPRQSLLVGGLAGAIEGLRWSSSDNGDLRLTLPAGPRTLRFTLWLARVEDADSAKQLVDGVTIFDASPDLNEFTRGGPPRWPQKLTTDVVMSDDRGPFAVDVLTPAFDNPWFCRMRLTGLDFFPDGDRAAVSAWDGSVWLVSGLSKLPASATTGSAPAPQLTWQRIASGLFQPLGVKIVEGKTYVTCRDQICVLHDLNGDGEIDFYENFNNDHQVTEHFHEFAMGLQTDAAGNFYYAKSARHALTALVPHHGTLLRVSKDGSRTDIVANGFRAANGVCVNPDGTFIVTDQEGHWNPKNRINWVREGGFYGNMFGYHDVTDSSDDAMEQPLCWITNAFDRSPAELLWVDSDRWGPLRGSLLNMSYGYGKMYVVPHEHLNGQAQGGMCELPIAQFPTGIMRGRFHPSDQQLYVCGMFAWAGNQQEPGGLYRIRYTGQPVHVPIGLRTRRDGLEITFSDALEPATATDPRNYSVQVWSLKRTANYGSEHYDERTLSVASAELEVDGRTIRLEIPDLGATWCMKIAYRLRTQDGSPVTGVLHNTIHAIAD